MQLTEDLVAELIFAPEQIANQPQLAQFVQACGGIQQCYSLLQSLPLNAAEQRLLKLVLAQPGASVDFYLQQLHIHKATFHRHQRKLLHSLTSGINQKPVLQTSRSWFAQIQQATRLPAAPPVDRAGVAYQRMLHLFEQGVRLINVVGDDQPSQQALVLNFAQQIGASLNDGCLWLDLTGSPSQALSQHLMASIQAPTKPNPVELLQLFQARQVLLILAGYQTHPDDPLWLRRLLEIAPKLVVICTSSQRLKLYGEFLVPIGVPSASP
ncbi:hypothetical protein [Herpetosiphon giganteus]|uniref:hypothetical protein n=1 Tax=Herpetosiphon giganteus TaxID=2029754 RepID=UPI0019560B67|nr:hypothetical protein [Herpetosiphon giganteus]MBM7843522.1 hypothetical protein [Herpetosiphon giganteus]